jgi:K+-transporting ATPase KdpF subunit
MSWLHVLGAGTAIFLLVYLVYALIKAEDF